MLIGAALALTACTKGRSLPQAPDAASAAAQAPTSAPTTGPDGQPLPSPDAPQSMEELNALSERVRAGEAIHVPGGAIERMDADRLRIGRVIVNRKLGTLAMPGRLNMHEGILEYYACGTDGKLHESVLEIFAEPSHIHLAMVLSGRQMAIWDRSDPQQVPTLVKPGGQFDLWVIYREQPDAPLQRVRAESWLYNRKTRAVAEPLDWFFHGSTFWNGRYAADSDRSMFALIPDDVAVAMVAGDQGNPYQGELQGFEVYKEKVPPIGTPLTLVVSPRGAPPPSPEDFRPTHSATPPEWNAHPEQGKSPPLPPEFAQPADAGAPTASP